MIYVVVIYDKFLVEMRFKNELYPEEQKAIKSELLDIIALDDRNSIVLNDIDNDDEKQKLIMNLLPRIRIFFSKSRVTAFAYPEKIQRPWLSIIRHLLKDDYNIVSKDYKIKISDGVTIRTKRYTFTQKE